MNNATASGQSTSSVSTPTSAQSANNDNAEARSAPTANNGWVAKRDRHMQLINSAVYDKESQTRAKAMEESRKAKAQKKAQVEQAKVLSYAKGVGRQYPPAAAVGPQAAAGSAEPSSTAGYQMFFNDIPFRIARGGSKLIRVSSATPSIAVLTSRTGLPEVDDPNTANNTPKRVSVAGVTFVRSKNGNLHRLGAVTSKRWRFTTLFGESRTHDVYRKPTTVKKKDELCKRFTTTGTPFPKFWTFTFFYWFCFVLAL